MLRTVNQQAETDVTKLPSDKQTAIRRALGNKEAPYDGCLNEECLNEETTWIATKIGGEAAGDSRELVLSRCSHCRVPKSFGRAWPNMITMLWPTLKRERASLEATRKMRARLF